MKSLETRPSLRKGSYYYYKFPQGTVYFEGVLTSASLYYREKQEKFEKKSMGCGLIFHEGLVGDAYIDGVVTCDDNVEFILRASRETSNLNSWTRQKLVLDNAKLTESCAHTLAFTNNSEGLDWNKPPSWAAWEPPSTHDLVLFSGGEFLTSVREGESAVAGGILFSWDEIASAPHLYIEPGAELAISGLSNLMWDQQYGCLNASILDTQPVPSPSPTPAPSQVEFDPGPTAAELNRQYAKGNMSLSWVGGDPGAIPARSQALLNVRGSALALWKLNPLRDWIHLEFTEEVGNSNVTVTVLPTSSTREPGIYHGTILMTFVEYPDLTRTIGVSMEVVTPLLEISPFEINQLVLPGTNGSGTLILTNNAVKEKDPALNALLMLRFRLSVEQVDMNITKWASLGSLSTGEEVITGETYEIPPEKTVEISLASHSSTLPQGTYLATIFVDADTYDETFKVLWRLRVALFNVCPNTFEMTLKPGEVHSRVLSVANISPREDIRLVMDLANTAPWLSVLSFPEKLEPNGLPHFVTFSIADGATIPHGGVSTSFDIIGNVESNDTGIILDGFDTTAERETVNIIVQKITGNIDSQASAIILEMSQQDTPDGVRVEGTVEIHLLDSEGKPISLGGARPPGLSIEITMWGRGAWRIFDDNELAVTIPENKEVIIARFLPDGIGTIEVNVQFQDNHIFGSPVFAKIPEVQCTDPTTAQTASRMECHCKAGFEPFGVEDEKEDDDGICKPCTPGFMKSSSGDEQCVPCLDNEFSWDGARTCMSCPREGAICEKGLLRLQDGYWRESKYERETIDDNVILHACRNPDACWVDRNITGQPAKCGEGHKGPLCDQCESNYAKSGNVCKKCENQRRNVVITVLLLFALFAAVMFIALKKKDQKDPETSPATLARLTVNWLQACALLAEFSIQVFDEVQTLLRIGDSSNGGSQISLHNVQCVLQLDYFEKFYIIMSVPIVAIAVPGVMVVLLLLRDKIMGINPLVAPAVTDKSTDDEYTEKPQSPFHRYRDVAMSATVALLFLCYNTVLKAIVTTWDFYPHDIDGKRHLRADFAVTEDQSQYKLIFALSLIGTVVYIIGIPLIGLRVLVKNRQSLSTVTTRRKFGFLYEGYRRDKLLFVIWEIIVLARKAGLGMIAILITDGLLQLAMGIFILFVAIILQESMRPYLSKTANRLEITSLFVLLSTAVAALINHTRTAYDTSGARFGIALTVIILNSTIAAAFVVALAVLSSKRIMVVWRTVVDKCLRKTKEWRDGITSHMVTEEMTAVVGRLTKGEKVDVNTLVKVFSDHAAALRELLADQECVPKHARAILLEASKIVTKQEEDKKRAKKPRRLSFATAQKEGWLSGTGAGDMSTTVSLMNPLTIATGTASRSRTAKERWRKLRIYVKMFGAMGILSMGEQKALEREQQVDRVLEAAGKSVADRRSTFRPELNYRKAGLSTRGIFSGNSGRIFEHNNK